MGPLEKLNAIKSDEDFENFVIKYCGKEQFRPGLERLGHYVLPLINKIKRKNPKIFTIAGTNGKGETAFSLEYLLRQEGFKTALWTSPHILSIRERFIFDGSPITLVRLKELMGELLASSGEFPNLSYYELLFVLFCYQLSSLEDENLMIVLEVGLGGRFDAVNLFDADICAITSISRDHEAILGRRYDQILREKFGVARKDKIILTQFFSEYLNQKINVLVSDLRAKHLSLSKLGFGQEKMNFSKRNRMMASALALKGMGRDLEQESFINFLSVLDNHNSKGREEVMTRGHCRFIFIGSHNCEGMRELVARVENSGLQGINRFDGMLLSFSQRSEQDVYAMLKMVTQNTEMIWDKVWLQGFEHPKAYEKLELKRIYDHFVKTYIKRTGLVEFIEDNSVMLKQFVSDDIPRNILVTGSYYFVSNIQKKISNL